MREKVKNIERETDRQTDRHKKRKNKKEGMIEGTLRENWIKESAKRDVKKY